MFSERLEANIVVIFWQYRDFLVFAECVTKSPSNLQRLLVETVA
jgi:hypothetical protein